MNSDHAPTAEEQLPPLDITDKDRRFGDDYQYHTRVCRERQLLDTLRQLSEAKARIAQSENFAAQLESNIRFLNERIEAAEAKLKECERQRDHTWTQRNADLFAERNALAAKLKAVEGIMREKIESYADYGTKIYLKPNVDALLARIREAIQ